jgi:hypothetical protein
MGRKARLRQERLNADSKNQESDNSMSGSDNDEPYGQKNVRRHRKLNMPSLNSILQTLVPSLLCMAFGYMHVDYLARLFENHIFFSHLGHVEREISFRTECGLYYSYFKNLVATRKSNPNTATTSMLTLLNKHVLNDARTEHPLTINALQRFNLYPEVVLAAVYRAADSLQLLKRECFTVEREKLELPAVQACIGSQDPMSFYTRAVWNLHGLGLMLLFILCWQINNKSAAAGLIGCAAYMFNHGEATRVMWTPALRESFSFPFHHLQMIAVFGLIKSSLVTRG